ARVRAATASVNVGVALKQDPRRRHEAEPFYREGIKVDEQLVAEFPDEPGYRRHLISDLFFLASLLTTRDPASPEAEATYRRALQLADRQVKDFPETPGFRADLAQAYNDLGAVLRSQKRLEDAEQAFRD